MEHREAETLARELMNAHGVGDWTFGWNRRKRALGLCRYHERRIELSMYFVRDNGLDSIRDTILHEIAHALAGQRAGHGPRWKAACIKLGCKPDRCDKGDAVMPRGRWVARCPRCTKEYWRHKRPLKNARYWCRTCGPATGQVQFFLQLSA
jgi:predicted SprT family Zn-dependent metalloprotease